MSNDFRFLMYQSAEENVSINAIIKDETIWLSQKGMAELFGCSTDNISLHLKNIFSDGELTKDSVTEKISVTAADGKNYPTQFYNLDAIISVGYFLLGYARERHMAARVDFIYELSPEDLPALFRLARTFVYLPDAEIEASIVPVVEALRAGLPMVLSDTRLNREAAGDAAVYVDPEAVGEVAAALENVLWDETFRSEMRRRERRRAELFSEYAVARRLIDIYTSL